jgi:hypothetical protein
LQNLQQFQRSERVIVSKGDDIYNAIVKALSNDKGTLEQAVEKYNVSEDVQKWIKAEVILAKESFEKATRLKDTISNAMKLYGILEIKTETLKLNFRRSEGVVCTFDNPQKFDIGGMKITCRRLL